MTNIAKALQDFWAGFGIPAFVEGTVPDKMPDAHGDMQPVKMPYITYRLAFPDWLNPMSMYARVWYRGTSFLPLSQKVDEIAMAIGDSGVTIPFQNGFVTLMKDANFCQYLPDESEDGAIKTAYLSLVMHAMEV